MDTTDALEPLYFSVQLDDGVTGETTETTDRERAEKRYAEWVAQFPHRKVSLCQIYGSELKVHEPETPPT